MGLTSFKGVKVRRGDVTVAKNYMTHEEISTLNLIVNMYLDYAELQAKGHNKRLLEAPRNCIEYVVMHEFCHFIHPNHSKHFYSFLAMLMPDWKERKTVLDRSATFWL